MHRIRRPPAPRAARLAAALLAIAVLASGCRLPADPSPSEEAPRMTPGDQLPSPTLEIPPPIN
ncbi:MAG TPA: hypothetical protein VFQ81_01630 [Candidatus Limnocylindria bacterium]|nr:hypothetical protein [Candidatus Limnocylindria bacterium]